MVKNNERHQPTNQKAASYQMQRLVEAAEASGDSQAASPPGCDNGALAKKEKQEVVAEDIGLFLSFFVERMDRYGLGYALLLQDTSVIGTQAWPSLTDYSYHLVWFHEAIIRLHTPPTSRTTSHTVRLLALPPARSLFLPVTQDRFL